MKHKFKDQVATNEVKPVEGKPIVDQPVQAKIVNAPRVNFRTNHSLEAGIANVLAEGTMVELLGEAVDDWSAVKYGDRKGWIMTKYVKVI